MLIRTAGMKVRIIGAGLAGSEAALQLADRGIEVDLHEMKPAKRTPAQVADGFAELVCSNSFRGAAIENAVGAIKEEMRRIGGRLIRVGDACAVPAGGALAVDRERFSAEVTRLVNEHPRVRVIPGEVTGLPPPERGIETIVATGPLTSDALAESIRRECSGRDRLYFYDAIAPIVAADSIDESIAFRASRYGKGDGDDYLNCPLDKQTYETFIDRLLEADRVTPRPFEEDRFFEGCLPIEVMAGRGRETLRFGCMKPVGLDDPRTGRWPHAVVQLRAENRERTAYNLVGFQTRLKWGAQKELFRTIPGLESAEILRFGSIHRNTYLDSPASLDRAFRLMTRPDLSFAGQITGVEGYVESMACGLLVALMVAARAEGRDFEPPPDTTTLGALYRHVLGLDRAADSDRGHVPSNVHWGMVAPLRERAPKREKKTRLGERALREIDAWWARARGSEVAAARVS
jgi:methylenetetrahydrofolate--tRNA-(uracil-5-)-methyltransferase